MPDSRPLHILLVKLSSMGDIIHTLPVPCSLRVTYPEARVAWVVERRWLPLVEHHPCVDEVFTVDSFAFRRRPHRWQDLRNDLRRVRAFAADWVLDLQGTGKSAVVTRLCGARMRAGFSFSSVRETLSALSYNVRVEPRSAHVVDELLDLAETIGPLRREYRFPLDIPEESERVAKEWLRANSVSDFVFFSPGGGWNSKRWPTERYAQVADLLRKKYGVSGVINRGPGDPAGDHGLLGFSGDVMALAALLKRARLVVGGDTGPVQMAAVLGVPTVALFGPTDPDRNRPYTTRGAILRKGTHTTYRRSRRHSPGMLAIQPEEVAEAGSRFLAANA